MFPFSVVSGAPCYKAPAHVVCETTTNIPTLRRKASQLRSAWGHGVTMPHALHPSPTTPVAGCREKRCCPKPVAYGSRRRRASVRSAGCGTFLLLVMMLASTAGASPFKRWGNRKGGKGGQQQSVSSKRSGTAKRDKVRDPRCEMRADYEQGLVLVELLVRSSLKSSCYDILRAPVYCLSMVIMQFSCYIRRIHVIMQFT